MIGRFLCWLGRHKPQPGCDTENCIAWDCHRCGAVSPGGYALERRRR